MAMFICATRNQKKIMELSPLFKKIGHQVIPLSDIEKIRGVESTEMIEDGHSFYENAFLKSKQCFDRFSLPVVSDDSGLVIPCLGGEPGIYSARYAQDVVGVQVGDRDNIDKVVRRLKNLGNLDNYEAYFETVLVAMFKLKKEKTIEQNISDEPIVIQGRGVCHGEIVLEPRGENRFGYDPIFVPREHNQNNLTFAEMSLSEKNKISHRTLALEDLMRHLEGYSILN